MGGGWLEIQSKVSFSLAFASTILFPVMNVLVDTMPFPQFSQVNVLVTVICFRSVSLAVSATGVLVL